MQSPTKIIVSVEKQFNDEVTTDSGIKFYKDTTYKPEWNVVSHGKVEAIARRVPKDFTVDGFYNTVEVGDTLYFHYLVVMDEDNRIDKNLYLVDYFQALATVRDGKIYPVGEHILIEPLDAEVTHDFLVIPEMMKKRQTTKGRVFSSNDPSIPNGSIVEYEELGKFENEIEGRKFFVMYNSNILVKHEKGRS